MDLKPWKVLSSEYVLDTPWFKVRADRCETQTGDVLDPFYVIEERDAVHIFPVTTEGKVLISRQYRHSINRLTWEIPCGAIDSSDESPLKAAQREFLEETGYQSAEWVKLGEFYAGSSRFTSNVHSFIARGIDRVSPPSFDHGEYSAIEFRSIPELVTMLEEGEFADCQLVATAWLGIRAVR